MTGASTSLADRLLGWSDARLRAADDRLPRSRFGRFGVAHSVIAGADAATSLALAGSLFFDLEPGAAKSKVLQYLLISLAPFVVVAPFIGPLVDLLGSRRRWVVTVTSLIKAATCLFMARDLQSLWLFPEAFLLLVCGKATAVARSSIVPEIVRTDDELVQANSRLSLIAVFGGAVGLAPAWVVRELFGNQWVLRVACLGFLAAALASLRIRMRPHQSGTTQTVHARVALPVGDDRVGSTTAIRRERADTYSEAVRVSGFVMAVLRGVVGLVMFLSLMSLRNEPLWWSGLTLGALSVGTSIGALVAGRLRHRFDESRIIIGAAGFAGVVAALCALNGGKIAGVVVAATVGWCGSIARLSFDAVVQRDQAVDGQGAAFARFETRFQLSWVLGALVATGVEPPRAIGLLLIAGAMAGACAVGVVGEPALEWLVDRQTRLRQRLRPARDGSARRRQVAQTIGVDQPDKASAGRDDGADDRDRLLPGRTPGPAPTRHAVADDHSPRPTVGQDAPTQLRLPILSTTTKSRKRSGRRTGR